MPPAFIFTTLLDSSGSVIVKYTYDGWGNHVVTDQNGVVIESASHIGNINPIRYRGYYYDTETKLYYLKTRYYDPEICRFVTIDDVDYAEFAVINGLNLYAYCGNNPVMRIDPNGNDWWHWLLGIVAAISMVVVVVASAIITGGASLISIGVGMGIGATASLVGQGVGNVLNGKSFFENIDVVSILLGGLAGAAYATGLGGAFGAFGIGVASNIAVSAYQQKAFKDILFSGAIGGFAAMFAYGVGQLLNNVVYLNNDATYSVFFDAARVDGANLFQALSLAFASVWYKFLPNVATGLSRVLLNMIGKSKK